MAHKKTLILGIFIALFFLSGKSVAQEPDSTGKTIFKKVSLTILGPYAKLYYNGVQDLDSNKHEPDGGFLIGGEASVTFGAEKYNDGTLELGWYLDTKGNLDGFMDLDFRLDKYLSTKIGHPKKTMAILKSAFSHEERYRNVPTLDLIQSSGPGGTMTLKNVPFNGMTLTAGGFLKKGSAELGTSLELGKWFKGAGSYYQKNWMAGMRLDFPVFTFVGYHHKDSVTSAYVHLKPWTPKKITGRRPNGYMEFFGSATYAYAEKKVKWDVGFLYTIPIPLLLHTKYTFATVGFATDFRTWIKGTASLDIRDWFKKRTKRR